MDQAAIGNRIKTMRERANLTQEQLAELVDISPTHMSVIERGVKTPKLDTFVRIANALGVSADALLQDVVDHANESILSELSAAIGRMPKSEQTERHPGTHRIRYQGVGFPAPFVILPHNSTDFSHSDVYTSS